MSGTINRRKFLKMMGWGGVGGAALTGCDLPTTVTLEEGKEEVVSYLMPEEFVIPGVGVWYASTCTQCAGGCGLHGRVREGRVLKLEGNPHSDINNGNTCMMGQAGVQAHYNPDRIQTPMLRQGGNLVKTSWKDALDLINKKVSEAGADKVAWVTGTISGHQMALLNNHMSAFGIKSHYVQEWVNNAVWKAVSRDMLGDANAKLNIAGAKAILNFGADFLASWGSSPVYMAGEYAKFRLQKPRGVLVSVEAKMSLTGGNSDMWVPAEPGSEAIVALGVANILIGSHGKDASMLSDQDKALIGKFDAARVSKESGVSADQLNKIAKVLASHSPSLVLAGAGVEAQKDGYNSVAAIMLLNRLLGNIGQTITPSGKFPFEQLVAKTGNTADIAKFAKDANDKKIAVAFITGSNPLFTAPASLKMKDALGAIGFKVSLSMFMDETTSQADLVLPLASYLEDWGTHVAAIQGEHGAISVQQPLMEPLYPETKGFGDILLAMLKAGNKEEYKQYADYYAYLRHAFSSMPDAYKAAGASDETAWQTALQTGIISVSSTATQLSNNQVDIHEPKLDEANAQYPLHLLPTARLGMWDGRHANLPWLQEAPDQISKVVWGSWAEIHPETAAKFGIKKGDMIKVSSAHGDITVQAVVIHSVHKDVIAIPMGQGHSEYGRFASNVGVNPMQLVSPDSETKTGELAMYSTRVNVAKTGKNEVLVRLGSSDSQMGRRFVRTISAKQLGRTEGA